MVQQEDKPDIKLRDFLYFDKFVILATIAGAVITLILVLRYDFPVLLIYSFVFLMMAVTLYHYLSFIQSKNIRSKKTKEGVIVEVEDKKWLEPKKFFQKVGIGLLLYYLLVGIFYYYSRRQAITQALIFLGFIVWGWLIKRGIAHKE